MLNLFTTKDFNTIVLLKYYKLKWVKVDTDTRGTKRVSVDDSEALQKILLDYDNGLLEVDAKELFRAIEEVKEFVHR